MQPIKQRPPLTTQIPVQDFRDFYWLKVELQTFCQSHGLSTSGGKIALANRIEHFLRTGEKSVSIVTQHPKIQLQNTTETASLETIIEEGFICSQDKREFFESIIGPRFRFTVKMQQFFRENVGKTYQDAVDAWYTFETNKKTVKDAIDPQFEYNRFIRAFYEDTKNKGLPLAKAIQAWKIARSRPTPPVYSADEDYFSE